jgi:hypothetical protein
MPVDEEDYGNAPADPRFVRFGRPAPGDEPMQADADPMNADWTKKSWDLPYHDVDGLRAYLKASNISVEHFKELPVYRMNVDKPGLGWLRDL